MGITHLLPFLDKSTRPCHVREFRGSTVAIDSYCWIHKGATGCADELARGQDTDKYVKYCVKYLQMLKYHNITPIMVFDGKLLPAKLITEKKRRDLKKSARKQAMDLLRMGQIDEARKFFRQCIDVTPEMALKLIKELRRMKIDYIVAPYESDAQLAYLNIQGIADYVITEDSDLLLFGCKKVIYKLDLSGAGKLVQADLIHLSMNMTPDQYTFDKFRHMCILSGCDYVNSLYGIGLKKALKFIRMTAETNPEIFLDRLPRYLNLPALKVDAIYKENFFMADATFCHMTVFDPITRKLVPLNDYDSTTNMQYCRNAGALFDNAQALQLAMGNLNPLTMEIIDDYNVDTFGKNYRSRFKHECNKIMPKDSKKNISNKELTKSDDEEITNQHDIQLKKELEFYSSSRNPIPTTISTSSEENTNDNLVEMIPKSPSPVLGNNPFIKRKLSSKFCRRTNNINNNNDNQVVASRFFVHTDSIQSTQSDGTTSPAPTSNDNDDEPMMSSDDALDGQYEIISPMELVEVVVTDEDVNDSNSVESVPEILTGKTTQLLDSIMQDNKRKAATVHKQPVMYKPTARKQLTIDQLFSRMRKN